MKTWVCFNCKTGDVCDTVIFTLICESSVPRIESFYENLQGNIFIIIYSSLLQNTVTVKYFRNGIPRKLHYAKLKRLTVFDQ